MIKGSILGPVLFTIGLINGVGSCCKMFADDTITKMYNCRKIAVLQDNINKIVNPCVAKLN